MSKRLLLLLLFCYITLFAVQAGETGYRIEVQMNGYAEKELYLGYYFGDKTYVKDTAYANGDGKFVFRGKELLPSGIYIVVVKPSNNFLQLLIDSKNQQFSIATTLTDLVRDMDVNGSQDNRLLYQYLNYLNGMRNEATQLQEAIDKKEPNASAKQVRLDELNKKVKQYQQGLLQRYPATLFATFLKANMPPEQDMPSFSGKEEEQNRQRYLWARSRWFQHINLSDPFFVRTPVLWERVNAYLTNMTVQQPDSVIVAVEEVLNKAKSSEETYRYFITELLNFYARSNIVGMDKVYVHIAEKYYATGVANWVETEQKNKIVTNARALRPVLLGVKAPALKVETADGMQFNLHKFKASFTVLYFWNPQSGIAVKELETLKTVANNYKDKGVRIVTIYKSKENDLQQKFTAALQKYAMDVFLNTLDANPGESGSNAYNIVVTPQLFVLDANMMIVMKKISASQLSAVLDTLLKK
jgi:hypothetical protein